jgi:hypothetical protein
LPEARPPWRSPRAVRFNRDSSERWQQRSTGRIAESKVSKTRPPLRSFISRGTERRLRRCRLTLAPRRKSGSQLTRRWRKQDSNPRSPPSTVSSVHPGARHDPRFAERVDANDRQYAEAWGGFHMRQSRSRSRDRLRRLRTSGGVPVRSPPGSARRAPRAAGRRRFLQWHFLSSPQAAGCYDP